MFTRIFNKIILWKCKHGRKIPLFTCYIDLQKYHKAVKGSCDVYFHPKFLHDMELRSMAGEMIDYLRENYDMNDLLDIDKWGNDE